MRRTTAAAIGPPRASRSRLTRQRVTLVSGASCEAATGADVEELFVQAAGAAVLLIEELGLENAETVAARLNTVHAAERVRT